MAMKVTLEEFLGVEEKPALTPENIAFKSALDFEAEVFKKLKEKNLSQKDLADILDISPAAVSKMLTRGSNITIKTMAKIAFALDCVLAPIQLKESKEYSYFDIHETETASVSFVCDEIKQKSGTMHVSKPLTTSVVRYERIAA